MACVEKIFKELGSIDILINNTGFSSYGAIEAVTIGRCKMVTKRKISVRHKKTNARQNFILN